jgi:Tol biopolymer transport system component
MRRSSNATTALVASLAAVAALVLVSCGAAGATTEARSQRPARSSSPSLVTSSVSALTGVLAYVSNSDYYSTDGGEETLVSALPEGTHRRTLLRPANVALGLLEFSPSGRRLAYFRASASAARIDVMTVANRKVVSVFALGSTSDYVDGLAWTPSGDALIVGSNGRPGSSRVHTETALWRVPVGGGKPKQLTSFEDAGYPAVMPDGDIVYIISKTFSSSSDSLEKSAVWMSGPNGKDAKRIFTSTHFVDTPAVSPDGRTLALSVVVGDDTTHLESVTLASGRRRNLTQPVKGRTDITPSWSPSGSDIVFLSSRAGRHATTKSKQLLDAYVMTATGKNPKKVIARSGDKWSVVSVSWGR